LTETELIKGCIQKDEACQRRLFELYAGKMMSVCMRFANDQQQAQDILQESFIKVFKFIHQFKFEGSFEGWMRRVFITVATRYVKKGKLIFSDIDAVDVQQAASIDPSVVSKISEEEIHKLIRKLPDGYRIIFSLNVIEGYNHDEIATMLGIQATTSRTQLLKARKVLQALIIKQHHLIIL
jgi:RNA polymerase sigma factor (sigma-70 family)